MNKEKMENPSFEFVRFENADVIATSYPAPGSTGAEEAEPGEEEA